jgi:TldD protein
VRGATLVGNGLGALRAIDGIAGDLEIATGFCGKDGQAVPAGVGQPHVRIRELTVGGVAE